MMKIPGNPDDGYLIKYEDSYLRVDRPNCPIRIQVDRVEAFGPILERWAKLSPPAWGEIDGNVIAAFQWSAAAVGPMTFDPTIYVGGGGGGPTRWPVIEALFYSGAHNLPVQRWAALCEFTPTPVFEAIVNAAGENEYRSQRDLLRFMQYDLRIDGATLAIFRNLKLSSVRESSGQIDPSRESLGERVNRAAAAAGGDIPEAIHCECELFEELTHSATFTIAVDMNLADGSVALRPDPGEIFRARRAAIDVAEGILRHSCKSCGLDVSILHGQINGR
jgi:hypothetical protein